ncbi:MAG: HIT domain-containing protein [Sulfolobales archaeon]|nr:HIT domain-containing protein [Sulfolobales archaeon]MCX8208105.1 HIT domain-containing protein [Sulfolobales archaeon]MDW8010591.1 HIT domain-containing protein [Sulfolobales archaeon]
MRVLWAPWRMSYIKRSSEVSECLFCKAYNSEDFEKYLVLVRTQYSLAMLNAYPYNTAHVMIAPRRHVPKLEMLYEYEVLDLFNLAKLVMKAIDEEYRPEGYNIGLNIGRTAGAGIEAHIHIHIVPRWSGDTNFMPIIASTKVIPEDLKTTLARLKSRLNLT